MTYDLTYFCTARSARMPSSAVILNLSCTLNLSSHPFWSNDDRVVGDLWSNSFETTFPCTRRLSSRRPCTCLCTTCTTAHTDRCPCTSRQRSAACCPSRCCCRTCRRCHDSLCPSRKPRAPSCMWLHQGKKCVNNSNLVRISFFLLVTYLSFVYVVAKVSGRSKK